MQTLGPDSHGAPERVLTNLSHGRHRRRPNTAGKFAMKVQLCQPIAAAAALALSAVAAAPALAHHGFGLFQMQEFKDYSGTLTKLELVNPHSYLYFETVGADGKPLEMRCEMRAATLIRRSGWKVDEFVAGR